MPFLGEKMPVGRSVMDGGAMVQRDVVLEEWEKEKESSPLRWVQRGVRIKVRCYLFDYMFLRLYNSSSSSSSE